MRLVVVGASLAGLRACEAARRAGWTGEVVLVGAEEHLPYDRPPLSKALLELDGPRLPPTHRSADELAALGVELRLGAAATALDLARRVVHVGGDDLAYDRLVLATGAQARTVPGARTLRTVEDAVAVRTALDAAARTVVVGAGFIGAEIASAARARGLQVTLVEAAPVPLLRAAGPVVATRLLDLHRAAGVDLRCGVSVDAVRPGRVSLSDGTVVAADLVVAGTGATPATGWLAGSGLLLQDGVVCDEGLQAAPGVWAAGDVARWPSPLLGLARLEHWTAAAEQGAHAGRAAAGEPAPFTTVPYAWSQLHGRAVQAVGRTSGAAVEVVGDDAGWVALYRDGDRLVGALSVDLPGRIIKLKRLVAAGATFAEGLTAAAGSAAAGSARPSLPAAPTPGG